MQEERVEIVDTHQSLRWYRVAEGGDRGFCEHCGNPVFFRADQWPGELHLARALFVDPSDREPQLHAYYDTHLDWAQSMTICRTRLARANNYHMFHPAQAALEFRCE